MAGHFKFRRSPGQKDVCPRCGKKGVGQPRVIATSVATTSVRRCRYCEARGVRRFVDGKYQDEVWHGSAGQS
jgi:hypothetical protein